MSNYCWACGKELVTDLAQRRGIHPECEEEYNLDDELYYFDDGFNDNTDEGDKS